MREVRSMRDFDDTPDVETDRERKDAPTAYPGVPYLHAYSGIASEHRRGRFYGYGPKGYRRSDERILEEVSDRLMAHPDIDPSDIEVQVRRGVVSLVGTAEDRHEKRLAELIAEDVVGVDDVDNRLKVRHGFWAAVSGERASERASERELPTRTSREPSNASRVGGRVNAARGAARRDAEAR